MGVDWYACANRPAGFMSRCNRGLQISVGFHVLGLVGCEWFEFNFCWFGFVFCRLFHVGQLYYVSIEEHSLSTGIDLIAAENKKIQPETDQFIVRLVPHKVTGHLHLLNELVVRLNNGFPTTEREARLFEERQEANLQKLAKELLGADIQIGKKKDQGPKVKPNEPCKCGSGKKYKKCCGTNVL